MEIRSLGLIETWGLTAAVEAADAGAKAANVTVLGTARGKAGLLTVGFSGDVAAVKAAVNAAEAAARRVGTVVAVHVIPRPNDPLKALMLGPVGFGAAPKSAAPIAPEPEIVPEPEIAPEPSEPPQATEPDPTPEPPPPEAPHTPHPEEVSPTPEPEANPPSPAAPEAPPAAPRPAERAATAKTRPRRGRKT